MDVDETANSEMAEFYHLRSHSITGLLADDKGSYDCGDPNTTNIYLGNISPKVRERLENSVDVYVLTLCFIIYVHTILKLYLAILDH